MADEIDVGATVDENPGSWEESMDATYDEITAEESEGPARGADGRFASTTESDVPEGEAVEPGETQDAAEPESEADVPATEAAALPEGLTAEEKEAIGKLPPEAQDAFTRLTKGREADFTRKSQETAELRRQYEPVSQALEPVRSGLRQSGVSDGEYINRLVAADRALSQNPHKFLTDAAQAFGVDLEDLANGAVPQVDPRLAALEQRLQRTEVVITQQQQQAEEAAIGSTVSEIKTFAAEKGADGSALRPHFEAVFNDMLPLVAGLKQHNPGLSSRDILDKAYTMAASVNDAVRLKETADNDAARQKAAGDAAKVARKSSTAPISKTGVRAASTKPGNWADSMDEAYERAQRA